MLNKREMYENGIRLINRFLEKNPNITPVNFVEVEKEGRWSCLAACGWYRHGAQLGLGYDATVLKKLLGNDQIIDYRKGNIFIKIWDCANVGWAGRAWSYPGYVIDRTPYGVLAHEMGHHVDTVHFIKTGKYLSKIIREQSLSSDRKPITGYCPHDADKEWFAEVFRLYLTNYDLCNCLRASSVALINQFVKPADTRNWRTILKNAPDRTFAMALSKIETL